MSSTHWPGNLINRFYRKISLDQISLEQIQSKSDVGVVLVNLSGPFIRKVHSELETCFCLYKVVQCVTVLLLFLPDCLALLKEVDYFYRVHFFHRNDTPSNTNIVQLWEMLCLGLNQSLQTGLNWKQLFYRNVIFPTNVLHKFRGTTSKIIIKSKTSFIFFFKIRSTFSHSHLSINQVSFRSLN